MLKFMNENSKICKQVAEVWKDKKEEERTRHMKLATQYSASSGVTVNQIQAELIVPLMDILGHGEAPEE